MKLKANEEIAVLVDKLNCFSPSIALNLIRRCIRDRRQISLLIDIIQKLNRYDQCKQCNFWRIEGDCAFCDHLSDYDNSILCIVHDQLDVAAIEDTAIYDGVFLVLKSKIIATKSSRSLAEFDLKQVFDFVKKRNFKEIIFANDFTLDGEWTARYIRQELEKKYLNIKYTKLSCGVPLGAEIDFVDIPTLKKALLHRNKFTEYTIF